MCDGSSSILRGSASARVSIQADCAPSIQMSLWPVEWVKIEDGGVGERLKPAVLKTVRPERVSGVRIPPPPPLSYDVVFEEAEVIGLKPCNQAVIRCLALQLCRPNSRCFIPTIATITASLLYSRLLDFISEANAGRTSGRRLPIPTRARATRAQVQFASSPCI
jgi:hypothetical protein